MLHNPPTHRFQSNSTDKIRVRLIEHLIYYCDENLVNHLDGTKYLEKIKNKVNNYINLYTVCDDIDFNWLM